MYPLECVYLGEELLQGVYTCKLHGIANTSIEDKPGKRCDECPDYQQRERKKRGD